jgi:lactate permease
MILLLSLAFLLGGTFFLKNIRIGALSGIVVQVLYAVLASGWTMVQTSAVLNGLAIALELGVLLFGAVAFYQFLLNNQRLAFLDQFVDTSPNRPYLLITYCIFLGSFFEGIAGFGVPPVLLIPLLVKSGFKPLTSIVVALSGSLNAVIFGALGAPLIIGLQITQTNETVNLLMFVNALSCVTMPFIITYLYGVIENVKIQWSKHLFMLIGSGVIYFVILFFASRFTVEYPSVITGSVGMVLFMLIYNPAVRRWGIRFWVNSFWPYALLIVFLLTAKFVLVGLSIVIPGGTKVISAYQPGLIFLLSIGVIALIFQLRREPFGAILAISNAAKRAIQTSLTILLLAIFSQLVRWEMVDYIGVFIAGQKAILEPFLLMTFGVLGAFITGSATLSNLLLNGLLSDSIASVGLAMAMLHTGSVLGNVISLQNIVMARSAVEQQLHDRDVLRYTTRTLLACLLCVSVSTAIWLIIERP